MSRKRKWRRNLKRVEIRSERRKQSASISEQTVSEEFIDGSTGRVIGSGVARPEKVKQVFMLITKKPKRRIADVR